MVDDRRKFIRYDIPLEVEFKTIDSVSDYFLGITNNFSRSGLCFISNSKASQLRDAIDLRIKLPDSNRNISVLGDIVWKNEMEDKGMYGIKLMAMEAEAKSIILENAYNRWIDKMRS